MNDLWTTPRASARGDRQQRITDRLDAADPTDPASRKVQTERLLTLLKSIRSAQEQVARPV